MNVAIKNEGFRNPTINNVNKNRSIMLYNLFWLGLNRINRVVKETNKCTIDAVLFQKEEGLYALRRSRKIGSLGK